MFSIQRVISTAFFCIGPVGMLVSFAGAATAQQYGPPPMVFAGVQSTIRTTGLSKPSGLAVDSKGNLYIADSGNDRVVEITAAGEQKTVVSGVVAGAALNAPTAVAVDTSFNIYVADPKNNRVVEVTPEGEAKLIGTGLSHPSGVAVDSSGNIYIADTGNGRIVEVSHGVQTVAVTSKSLGVNLSRPDGVSVTMWPGYGVVLNISDSGAGAIIAINVVASPHSGVAGGVYNESYGFSHPIAAIEGIPSASYFSESDYFGYGFFYIVDAGTHRVWAEACPPCTVEYVDYEEAGDDPGPAYSSSPATGVSSPGGIAADSSGNIYISDSDTNRILKLTTGHSADFGSVAEGKSGAPVPLTLSFTARTKMTMPSVVTKGTVNKDFKLADSGTCKVGEMYEAGTNCTVDVIFAPMFRGEREGALIFERGSEGIASAGTVYLHGVGQAPLIAHKPGAQTTMAKGFSDPRGVTIDGNGNAYVADYGDGEIYQVTPSGTKRAFAALKAPKSLAIDGAGNLYAGGTPGVVEVNQSGRESDLLAEIGFVDPEGLAVDGSGDLFTAYAGNDVVAENTFTSLGGRTIQFRPGFTPGGVAVGSAGNVFITDQDNSRVWRITPKGEKSTLGTGYNHPQGIAVDAEGNVFVADFGNDRVVEITPAGMQSTVGSGLSEPTAVSVDDRGNLYITDSGNGRLVKIDRSAAPAPSE